jgi:Protein of unknown function (DUF3795)
MLSQNEENKMEYKIRRYPQFSACGLNCGLCPRYYTSGSSKCPGCAGDGFLKVHPSCGILSCTQRKGVEYCSLCDEYPCEKYIGADFYDSFISHRNQLRDLDKIKLIGSQAYEAELNEKIVILEKLLKNYDDGRRKSFYCTAVNLLNLSDLKSIMKHIDAQTEPDMPIKEKTTAAIHLLEEMAQQREISLKLRKKGK